MKLIKSIIYILNKRSPGVAMLYGLNHGSQAAAPEAKLICAEDLWTHQEGPL